MAILLALLTLIAAVVVGIWLFTRRPPGHRPRRDLRRHPDRDRDVGVRQRPARLLAGGEAGIRRADPRPPDVEKPEGVRFAAAGLGSHIERSASGLVHIRSGASTPTRSRQRATTVFVARQRPRRNASCSEPSTLWWW